MTQDLSRQMIDTLYNFFTRKSYIDVEYVGYQNSEIRFNSYNFNPVFLKVSSNQGREKYEVPSLVDNFDIREIIKKSLVGDYVVPLSVINTQTRRTADSMLKYFFNSKIREYGSSYVLGLNKAVTSKGEVYYGAPGLILNKDLEPIIIGMVEYMQENSNTTFYRNVLKINPNVFVSEGFLEKAIIKKLIPFYTRTNIGLSTTRVEIDDISKYIVKPVSPMGGVQKTLKDMMHTYKDEILDDLL